MAQFITPPGNFKTAGERRVAKLLIERLDERYWLWRDIPVGDKRRYPDFIILHPERGLLFLEIKDWKLGTFHSVNKMEVTLETEKGLVYHPNPLEQARQSLLSLVDKLARDPNLCQPSGNHQGNLSFPYGYGVVFTNIARKDLLKFGTPESIEEIFPDRLLIFNEELRRLEKEEGDVTLDQKLAGMIPYRFGQSLSSERLDRIRSCLFPEIRISGYQKSFSFDDEAEKGFPEIVRIMDVKQEKLARQLGNGHYVIHGVAGSGKTMILLFRCRHLAETGLSKPILVLCFNITLASWLRSFIDAKHLDGKVEVFHFHQWCREQLEKAHIDSAGAGVDYPCERLAQAVENGEIAGGQYGAVLIDEGHDFKPEWLALAAKMPDPETNSLLLLYDDAQSIYEGRQTLGFTLSSVGIQARGRTRILTKNYRNTKEITDFAFAFLENYLLPSRAKNVEIPLLEPEVCNAKGDSPVFKLFPSFAEEKNYLVKCLKKWIADGDSLSDIALLFPKKSQGFSLMKALREADVPCQPLIDRGQKLSFSASENAIKLVTIHSSKGLEFDRVIVCGIGQMEDDEASLAHNARLLYVGMTRARRYLLMTSSKHNDFCQKIKEGIGACGR